MSVTGTAGGRIAPGVGSNLIGQHAHDRNQEATCYVGNLDPLVTEELVWELFTQAGPVVNVYLPKDRVTNAHQGYGFVEFRSEDDADYAIKILNMIKVFGKPIRVNKASTDKKTQDVGANLFIGNLDPDVDEKLLYDTFSAFGVVVSTPKIMRDPETGNSRGFGFVSYDCFEASDASIEAMNGQFLCNRPISVSYAFKKDTKGERHGTPAERLLAAQQRAKMAQQSRPHTLFATGPKQAPESVPLSQQGPQAALATSGFAAGPMPPPTAPVNMPYGITPAPAYSPYGVMPPSYGGFPPGMPPPPGSYHGGMPFPQGMMPPRPGMYPPGMPPPPGAYPPGMPPPPFPGNFPPPYVQ
jgi:splicing factor 3B subunit 4